ncbi:MAG: hypothetical protein KTR26_18300 [Flammeovirgaceae bacterium]|nr:hypothetical protein [Flammeovirgaceae bacterium]
MKKNKSQKFDFIIYSLFFFIMGCQQDHCKNSLESFFSYSINGKIEKKYINKKNHNSSLLIVNNNGKLIKLFFGPIQFLKVWEEVNEGDSLVKELNTSLFQIFKPNGQIESILVECPGKP